MKREVKFRGKRLDNGKWEYGSLVIINGRYFIINDEWRGEVDSETVGQYTGMVDKTDKEIYEGDIVRGYPQGIMGKVIYHNDRIEVMDGNPRYWVGLNFFEPAARIVLGNIHDNPELL